MAEIEQGKIKLVDILMIACLNEQPLVKNTEPFKNFLLEKTVKWKEDAHI